MYYLVSKASVDPTVGEFTIVVPLEKGCCFKLVTARSGPFGAPWTMKNGPPINTGIE